jgi:hypothetical protein
LQTFWSALGFVSDFLIFHQRLETVAANFREVRKEVIAARIRGDETKALRIVEPFDSTGIQNISLKKLIAPEGAG